MSFLKKVIFLCFLSFYSQQLLANEWVYTFRPGDTLWDLCEKYIAAPDCWQKIAKRNKIEKPRHIKPGTRLYLPITWLKVLPVTAKVLSARGEAQLVKSDGKTTVPVSKAIEIAVGDQIITKEGTVTLQFADESILIITPGSEVVFDTLSLYGESGMVDTRVRLNRGRAKAKVKPTRGPASRYEILTPAAVAAVRGTEFRVSSEATDPPQMRTEVLEGSVAVGNEHGQQAIAAGYAVKAVSGETPAQPVKLLSAPVFVAPLPEEITAFPWTLKWSEIKAAAAYRVQVYSAGFFFDDLVQDQQVATESFTLSKLDEGIYKVLVSAIDQKGFEGMEASYTVAVAKPKELKPIQVSAHVANEQNKHSITWTWDAIEGVEKYQLRLQANTHSKGQQEKTIEVLDNQFVQGVTEPGTYQLQVAPVFGGQVLSYGELETVEIKDKSEAPVWAEVLVGTLLLLMIF